MLGEKHVIEHSSAYRTNNTKRDLMPHRVAFIVGFTAAFFLGTPAAFSDGSFRLAALLRRPVVFMAGLYLGGNRYQLRFVPLADFSDTRGDRDAAVRDALQRYASVLEQQCRETPRNWFNFFDFWAGADGDSDATAGA